MTFQNSNGELNRDVARVVVETILVVDDEPLMCDIFSEILRDSNYRVLTAGNGKEALELLRVETIDLLLTDIIMPEIDGFELAAKVAERYPHIKIQLMSGFSENGNEHLVSPKLLQQLLTKPVDLSLLLERVSKLLH